MQQLFQCEIQTHFKTLRGGKIARLFVANELYVKRDSCGYRDHTVFTHFSEQNMLSEERNPQMARSCGVTSVTAVTEKDQ